MTPDYQNAPAPAGEVAALGSSAHSERTPFLSRTWMQPQSSARGGIATTLRAGALIAAVASRCRAAILKGLLEEVQIQVAQRRRGYLKGSRCAVCHGAIHDDAEMCPKLWSGSCSICGPVLLDYYGHGLARECDPRRGHTISRRHKATLAEWERARSSPLTPTPITSTARGKPTSV
jgi:hypothetical protein